MKSKIHNKIYKTLAIAEATMQRAITVALLGILMLAGLYVYFVGSAIVSTVVYKEMRIEVAELHSDLATLETSYIEKKQNITNELATNLGLESLTHKNFITHTTIVGRAN